MQGRTFVDIDDLHAPRHQLHAGYIQLKVGNHRAAKLIAGVDIAAKGQIAQGAAIGGQAHTPVDRTTRRRPIADHHIVDAYCNPLEGDAR